MLSKEAQRAALILLGMGARVRVEEGSEWKEQFRIYSEKSDYGERFVNYGDIDPLRIGDLKGKKLNEFGIREDVAEILDVHGLCVEWIDTATVGVYAKKD